jgi:putative phosphoribosyl transferase
MFADRRAAGRQLAGRLHHLRQDEPLVLALPRGGVPIGFEIARELDAPLDLLFVRKIGVPWQPELALGAVVDGADPQVLINEGLVGELSVDRSYITGETARQLSEIERRRRVYLGDRPPPLLTGRTIIIVDDGIATAAPCALRLGPSERLEPEGSSSPSRLRPGTRSSN